MSSDRASRWAGGGKLVGRHPTKSAELMGASVEAMHGDAGDWLCAINCKESPGIRLEHGGKDERAMKIIRFIALPALIDFARSPPPGIVSPVADVLGALQSLVLG
jgi:hypothetical protein